MRRWATIHGLLLAVLSVASPANGAMTPEAYRAALAGAVGEARAATRSPQSRSVEAVRRVRTRIPPRATVTGADGLPVLVSNADLVKPLDAAIVARGAAERKRALDRFTRRAETLLAALEPRPASRSARENQVLQQVLGSDEFQPSPAEEWGRRFGEWLERVLRGIFGPMRPAGLDLIARVIYYLSLGVLIALLAYLIWTYVPGLRLRRRGRVAQMEEDGATTAPERAEAHLARAEAAAREGRYLEALRHTYLAMLLFLDAAERVPYDPSRTNWELLRLLRGGGHGDVRELLLPVTRLVDEKVYGGRPATEHDYDGCRDVCARLRGLLAS